MKPLNAHLGKRAIYSTQFTEGQRMQLVLTSVLQEPLILSIIYILILEMLFVSPLHYHSLMCMCHQCI